ncbi:MULTISPECIES: hypothetical protein [Gracilibacillus]|uniref:hypothetical protein n=1 Tax=Gracilibacillus TaxID=74385 RepID=UPI0008269577|nr:MULTISPECIES: hypothetical protein [Gracilibacillus]
MKKLWETLKTMSFKEAVDYIWEYYKLHIIGTILGVAFLWSILGTVFGEKEETFQITVLGQVPYDTAEAFSTDLNDHYLNDFRVITDSMITESGSLEDVDYAQVQKFWANMGANMIDVIIASESLADQFQGEQGLMPVDQYVDLPSLEEQEATLYRFGTEDVYGIATEDIPMFEAYPAFHDLIIMFPVNSENHERTEEVMDILMSEPPSE